MNYGEAKLQLQQLLGRVSPAELPKLLDWVRTSDELDDLVTDNGKVILQSIADDLRAHLPLDAMLPSEAGARAQMQRRPRPTVHVDAFLYDDEQVDLLCDGGKMSRSYCLRCGSNETAPLDFISHSFSVAELRFLFQSVLPDLSGRTLVDVGSRLGAVLYGFGLHPGGTGDQRGVCPSAEGSGRQIPDGRQSPGALLQEAHVLVMNNVFEYFLEPAEQVRCWRFIMERFRRTGSLLLTVPSLQESLAQVQEALPPDWVEELPLDHGVYMAHEADASALKEIHLYRVL
ncbi:uncharacterized protein ACB058_017836 isoform 3-T3 [Synchiropus picturatus]